MYSCDCIEKVLNILGWHIVIIEVVGAFSVIMKTGGSIAAPIMAYLCWPDIVNVLLRDGVPAPDEVDQPGQLHGDLGPGQGRVEVGALLLGGPGTKLTTPLYHHWALPPPVSSHQLIIQ